MREKNEIKESNVPHGGLLFIHENYVIAQVTLNVRCERKTEVYSIEKLCLGGRMKYCLIKNVSGLVG